jgi:hypothetical protein
VVYSLPPHFQMVGLAPFPLTVERETGSTRCWLFAPPSIRPDAPASSKSTQKTMYKFLLEYATRLGALEGQEATAPVAWSKVESAWAAAWPKGASRVGLQELKTEVERVRNTSECQPLHLMVALTDGEGSDCLLVATLGIRLDINLGVKCYGVRSADIRLADSRILAHSELADLPAIFYHPSPGSVVFRENGLTVHPGHRHRGHGKTLMLQSSSLFYALKAQAACGTTWPNFSKAGDSLQIRAFGGKSETPEHASQRLAQTQRRFIAAVDLSNGLFVKQGYARCLLAEQEPHQPTPYRLDVSPDKLSYNRRLVGAFYCLPGRTCHGPRPSSAQ